jgi:hypothetical protein
VDRASILYEGYVIVVKSMESKRTKSRGADGGELSGAGAT